MCARLDIPAAPYHTLESLLADPHRAKVGLLRQVEHPSEGRLVDISPPNKLSGGARRDWLPAPRLGEHTEVSLRDAGFTALEIGQLIAQGAAARAPAARA